MMEMTRKDSSHVWKIGHDPDTGILAVRYRPNVRHPAGRLVEYQGVDAKTAERVMNAPSVGTALNQFVKGIFEFTG